MKSRQMAGMGIAVVWGMAGAVSSVWAQGSLTPPGAPAPTMKTLAQVEPRIPITNAPYTITQPGSYYLTTNLNCTGGGIVIRADRVTVDLMGFSLTGAHTDYGIWVNGATNAALRNVTVRDGTISGFGYGVVIYYAQDSRIEDLMITSNAGIGVELHGTSGACNGNTLRGCTISGNTTIGLYLYGLSGVCDGNRIEDCAIRDNSSVGIFLTAYTGGRCVGNTIANCIISGNGTGGVQLNGSYSGTCSGNTIANCTINTNGAFGVYLYGYSGECDGNRVASCILRDNAGINIHCSYADGNRIENNHVSGATGCGIYSSASSTNLILQNSCLGLPTNYVFSANDTYGPIVTNGGALSTTNGAAGLSPWANFSR